MEILHVFKTNNFFHKIFFRHYFSFHFFFFFSYFFSYLICRRFRVKLKPWNFLLINSRLILKLFNFLFSWQITLRAESFASRNFRKIREFWPFSQKFKARKILFWPIRESLCSQNFSRFSLFFLTFFYFFLTSFFQKNLAWFLHRFVVPQVDFLLYEFSFAKLDFFILHAVLF